jgi:hypothetical protein
VGGFTTAAPMIAAVEGAARRAAAEEVQIAVAADLAKDATLLRLEGDVALGRTFAVRASVAYKGFWVRRTVSVSQDEEPSAAWADAAARFRAVAGELGSGADLAGKINGGFKHWSLNGPFGGNPLADLADDGGIYRRIGTGSVVNLSVQAETADGPWLGSGPVLLADNGDYRENSQAIFS